MNMNILHGDVFSYDPGEITTTLLQDQFFSYSGPEADFNREAITECIYWIKAAAENEKNIDMWRQFYNLLAAINDAAIVPF